MDLAELKKEHPHYFRVEEKYKKLLHTKNGWEYLGATNSTQVLIHHFAQYMYAYPDKHYGYSFEGFSKQTLNWLNLIMFFLVMLYVFVFMLLLPLVCLIVGAYGLVINNLDPQSNGQLIAIGILALIEVVARVIWYLIGRLDNKDSVFTFIETFDILPIPILAMFVWGIVEGIRAQAPIYISVLNVPLLLNVFGVVGWGFYFLYRLQKIAIFLFTETDD